MTENGNGYCVRMPRPAQLSKAARFLGKASFSETADMDELVKGALDDGRIEVNWSYVEFDADSLPSPTKVAQVSSYGQHEGDRDRVEYRDRYDSPTWRPCRKSQRPTVFPSREAAEKTVEEHVATAEHFGVVTGNLTLAQVVPVEQYEASLTVDPSDRITRKVTEVELAVAKRKAEEAAAEAAAIAARLEQSRPAPNSGDWHSAGEQRVQMRTRADGTKVFRVRIGGKDGRTSPSFDTLEEALQWRDAQ